MKLGEYSADDAEELVQLFIDVFSRSEGKEEGLLIGNLVRDLITQTRKEDIFGFAATNSNQIIASIFFTRLSFDNGINAFILSPVAVHSGYQNIGVGQELINFSINALKENDVALIFTYGDPNYYCKVGFKPISENIAKAPIKMTQPEGWLCQSLTGDVITPITGDSSCVAALSKAEYW